MSESPVGCISSGVSGCIVGKIVWGVDVHGDACGRLFAVPGDESTLRGGAVFAAVCGVEGSRISERHRTRGVRTGAHVEEFGSTGISDVSGIGSSGISDVSGIGSSVVVSGKGSPVTGAAGIGVSLDVEGPS